MPISHAEAVSHKLALVAEDADEWSGAACKEAIRMLMAFDRDRVALQTSLREMVRIVEAMRYTAGLGKHQAERLARAKALLPKAW